MRNHYARNRNHHSRLSISFHSERSSVQAPTRLRASLSFASLTGIMAEHLIRHERRNCVNLFRKFGRLSEQMSQPNHSNVNAQVSRIFGRCQFNPRTASKFLAFQTPDKHETNWYFPTYKRNRTNRSRSKAIQNSPFLCDLLLLAGPTVNVIPLQGRRVGARVVLQPDA